MRQKLLPNFSKIYCKWKIGIENPTLNHEQAVWKKACVLKGPLGFQAAVT
jgi:hypothetical protein